MQMQTGCREYKINCRSQGSGRELHWEREGSRGSVNDGISKELCSLSYMSVDEVAARVVELGKGALLAKFDLKAAYRNVPVHPDDRWLFGMVWEDQSLAGHLNHACKVVWPGRRFLRGIFGLISQFRKQDHMIRLNAAFRADLEWWHKFVSSWNGVSMIWRESLLTPGVEIWTDASGSWGCGAVWDSQ